MGLRWSRRNPVPQNNGRLADNPYRYPPPDGGKYFSTHFNLGSRRYPTGEPEVFLFGELNDLNFLNHKPVVFPYKQPEKSEPVKCLRSYINLQRDSVKLVKTEGSTDHYHIEFIFDSDTDCQFTIYTFLSDSFDMEALRNGPHTNMDRRVSRPYHYSSGTEQQFVETCFSICPDQMDEDQLTYDPENGHDNFPVAILMETDSTDDAHYQCQLTICTLDKPSDNGYTIKVLKQKLWVDGVEYLLQELYGLENKLKVKETAEETDNGADSDDDEEDLGAECVICITDVKDTVLLPCRHLCLCSGCAANLRYQSSNCPICRAPFRALLQITALQPLDPDETVDEDEATGNPEFAVEGYHCIPLIQALNGYTVPGTSEAGGDLEVEEVSDIESEAEKDAQSPREMETSQLTEQTVEAHTDTEVCVIPMDDALSNGTPSTHQSSGTVRTSVYEIDSSSIPLPGTPVPNDPLSIPVIPKTFSELSDDPEVRNQSCDSSTSSRQSVKSTDALLIV